MSSLTMFQRKRKPELIVDWPSSTSSRSNKNTCYETCARVMRYEVCFSDTTKVKFIEAADDPRAAWYTRSDYARFRHSAVRTICAMRGAISNRKDISSVNNRKRCIRGLENHSSNKIIQERASEKEAITKAVLEEQEWQGSSGYDDPLAIAAASCIHSQRGKERAAWYGKADAEDAFQIQWDATKFSSMTKCESLLSLQNMSISTSDMENLEKLDGTQEHLVSR